MLALWAGVVVAGLGSGDAFCPACTPPDVQVAAGPTYVLEAVNTAVRAFPRAGGPAGSAPLAALFGTGDDRLADPQLQYDARSGRWLATVLDTTSGRLHVAVSRGEDPTAGWTTSDYDLGPGCPDQPRLGTSDEAVLVAAETFTGDCLDEDAGRETGGVLLALDKADLLAGRPARARLFGPGLPAMTPAQSLGASTTAYAPAVEGVTADDVRVYAYSGGRLRSFAVDVRGGLAAPPNARQPGGAGGADTGSLRPTDAASARGRVHFAVNDTCAGRACVRVLSVDPARRRMSGDATIALPGEDDFYAALRPDATGALDVVYAFASEDDYPGMGAAAIRGGQVSLAPALARGTGATGRRFGDYLGAAVDPLDPRLVWVAGELGASDGPSSWRTALTAISGAAAGLPAMPAPRTGRYTGRTAQGRPVEFRVGPGGTVGSLRMTVDGGCSAGTAAARQLDAARGFRLRTGRVRVSGTLTAEGAAGYVGSRCSKGPVRWVARAG